MEQMTAAKKGKMADLLGQFGEGSFWVGLMKEAARETVKAFFLALAGTITYYIQKKFTSNVITQNPQEQNLSQKAFGNNDTYGGYNGYKSNSYYPTNNSNQPSSFPGFGSR